MSKFDDALAFVLREEGGYVKSPFDRGGATNKGITQATYDKWRAAQGFPPNDVKFITDSEVAGVYQDYYWQPAHCEDIPQPLSTIHFDSAVQHGQGRAVKFLQSACGIPADGKWGPQTAEAAANIEPMQISAYLDARRTYYDDIIQNDPSQAVFSRGWMNRVDACQSLVNQNVG